MLKQILSISMLLLCYHANLAQNRQMKPPLPFNPDWEKIPEMDLAISNRGDFFIYKIEEPNSQKSSTHIKATDLSWEVIIPNARDSKISSSDRFVCSIVRGDTLVILNTKTKKQTNCGNVASFQLLSNGNEDMLIYTSLDKELILNNLSTDRKAKFSSVDDFVVNLVTKSIALASNDSLYQITFNGEKMKTFNGKGIQGMTFSKSGKQLAFKATVNDHKVIYVYNFLLGKLRMVVSPTMIMKFNNGFVSDGPLIFSDDESRLLFKYRDASHKEQALADDDEGKIRLRSYHQPTLGQLKYGEQLNNSDHLAGINLKNFTVYTIAYHCTSGLDERNMTDSYYLEVQSGLNWMLPTWDMNSANRKLFLVSIKDGTRRLIVEDVAVGNTVEFSPNGKFVVYFDRKLREYFAIDVKTLKIVNLSKDIPYPIYDTSWSKKGYPDNGNVIEGYSGRGDWIVIADEYDLWRVDLNGISKPKNLTNGFGRKNQLRFRLLNFSNYKTREIASSNNLTITAFDTNTKGQGFYSLNVGEDPVRLFWEDAQTFSIIGRTKSYFNLSGATTGINPFKANHRQAYLIYKVKADESPNLYFTSDFRVLTKVTNVHPEKKYNWLTSDMITYNVNGEKQGQAILFKPEDFDPSKQYPVIFYYYEQLSDFKNVSFHPRLTGATLQIANYVSNGYIVCVPDIVYKLGLPGKSALDHVSAAANYLKSKPFVNFKRMGLQGHSWGGFETNYIVTHTNLFAAAVSAAGVSDMLSHAYDNESGFDIVETGQVRIGATFWEAKDSYIENSPLHVADKVTTPILIQVGLKDRTVPADQGVYFFSALKRLGKKAWLIEYEEAGHTIMDESLDYTRRMQQFFDHYLKDAPAPKWMTQGVKGEKGFEMDTE